MKFSKTIVLLVVILLMCSFIATLFIVGYIMPDQLVHCSLHEKPIETPIETIEMYIILGIVNSPFNGEAAYTTTTSNSWIIKHAYSPIYGNVTLDPPIIQTFKPLELTFYARNGSSGAAIGTANLTIYEVEKNCLVFNPRSLTMGKILEKFHIIRINHVGGLAGYLGVHPIDSEGDHFDNTCIRVVTMDSSTGRVIGEQTVCAVFEDVDEPGFSTLTGRITETTRINVSISELPMEVRVKSSILGEVVINGVFAIGNQIVKYTFYPGRPSIVYNIDYKGPYDHTLRVYPVIWAFKTQCPTCDPYEYNRLYLHTIIFDIRGEIINETTKCIKGC